MPVTAAKALLMIQEMTRTRVGLAPVWASRSGAATTACMATPSRVRRRKRKRPTKPATPTATVISCDQLTATPEIRKAVVAGKKSEKLRRSTP